MGRPVFGFPIYSDFDAASVSGGSWVSTPSVFLDNVLDPRLAAIARSASLSTSMTIGLGATRDIHVIAVPRHTLSKNATIRVQAGSYDSGTVPVWSEVYPVGVLPASHPSFSSRKYTDEMIAGNTTFGKTFVPPAPVSASSVTITFNDGGNPAGFFDIGRVVVCGGYRPSVGAQVGAALSFLTSTGVSEVDGGAEYFKVRPTRRKQTFALKTGVDEALAFAYEIQRVCGISGQLMFVFDEADVEHMQRRSFLARIRQLGALEWPYAGARVNTSAWELAEVL